MPHNGFISATINILTIYMLKVKKMKNKKSKKMYLNTVENQDKSDFLYIITAAFARHFSQIYSHIVQISKILFVYIACVFSDSNILLIVLNCLILRFFINVRRKSYRSPAAKNPKRCFAGGKFRKTRIICRRHIKQSGCA